MICKAIHEKKNCQKFQDDLKRDAVNNEAAKKTDVRGTVYHLLFKPYLLAEIAAHNSIASSSFSLSGVSVFLPLHTRATFKLVAYNVCVLRFTMLPSTLICLLSGVVYSYQQCIKMSDKMVVPADMLQCM